MNYALFRSHDIFHCILTLRICLVAQSKEQASGCEINTRRTGKPELFRLPNRPRRPAEEHLALAALEAYKWPQ